MSQLIKRYITNTDIQQCKIKLLNYNSVLYPYQTDNQLLTDLFLNISYIENSGKYIVINYGLSYYEGNHPIFAQVSNIQKNIT